MPEDTKQTEETKQLSPQEASDTDLDARMEEVDKKDEAREKAKSDRLRGPDGKFKPKETKESGSEEETGEETEPTTDIDPERQQTAIKALTRYKAAKSVLDAATKGDQEAIDYGLHLAQIQDDYDTHLKEKKAIADELASLKKSGGQTEDGSRSDGSKADQLDVDSLIRPLAKQLEEVTGEDLSEHIRTSFSGLSEALDNAHKRDIAERDKRLEAMNERFEQLEIDRARDALVNEYPQLKDGDTWKKVKSELDSLPESESRPDVLTRLDHAARIILAPDIAKQARSERAARNKSRDDSSPSANGRKAPAADKSKQQLMDEMLDAKMAQDDERYQSLKAELDLRN